MNPKRQTMTDAIAQLGKEVEAYRDKGLVGDENLAELADDLGADSGLASIPE